MGRASDPKPSAARTRLFSTSQRAATSWLSTGPLKRPFFLLDTKLSTAAISCWQCGKDKARGAEAELLMSSTTPGTAASRHSSSGPPALVALEQWRQLGSGQARRKGLP